MASAGLYQCSNTPNSSLFGQRTLPDAHHGPPVRSELARDAPVSSAVRLNAIGPELDVGAGEPLAAGTTMPKKAVHEQSHFQLWPGEVWFSRDRPVTTISTQAVQAQQPCHRHFGRLVAEGLHRRHNFRADFPRYGIHRVPTIVGITGRPRIGALRSGTVPCCVGKVVLI